MDRDAMNDWLLRRTEVIHGCPAPQGDRTAAMQEALALHKRGELALRGHPEFPAHRNVVFGPRGGMDTALMRFGGEFDFAGERWVVTAHDAGRTTIIGALRRIEVEALFEAGVFFDPDSRKAIAEQAERAQKKDSLKRFGLTRAAYDLAADLVDRVIQAGNMAPTDRLPMIGHRLPYAAMLVNAADTWSWTQALHLDNKTSRAAFERLTGVTLPKTLKGTKALLENEPPAGYERGRLEAGGPVREAVVATCAHLAHQITVFTRERSIEEQVKNRHFMVEVMEAADLARGAIERFTESGADIGAGVEEIAWATAQVFAAADEADNARAAASGDQPQQAERLYADAARNLCDALERIQRSLPEALMEPEAQAPSM